MFVRVKKIGRYEYLYLVETADLLDALIASAARHSRRSIVLSRFYRGELAELRRRNTGPDLVSGHLWRETGCQAVLRPLLADAASASTSSVPST